MVKTIKIVGVIAGSAAIIGSAAWLINKFTKKEFDKSSETLKTDLAGAITLGQEASSLLADTGPKLKDTARALALEDWDKVKSNIISIGNSVFEGRIKLNAQSVKLQTSLVSEAALEKNNAIDNLARYRGRFNNIWNFEWLSYIPGFIAQSQEDKRLQDIAEAKTKAYNKVVIDVAKAKKTLAAELAKINSEYQEWKSNTGLLYEKSKTMFIDQVAAGVSKEQASESVKLILEESKKEIKTEVNSVKLNIKDIKKWGLDLFAKITG